MIHLGSKKILGLALVPDGALAAQIILEGGTARIVHLAEFITPDGLTMEKPAEFGRALGAFLRSHGIHTRETVLGLPARKLLSRRKEVPPANYQNTVASLRLVAETEFAAESHRIMVDFAGTPSSSSASHVLLFATENETIAQAQKIAESAGLRLAAITSTSAALAATVVSTKGSENVVITLHRTGAEAVVSRDQIPTQIRHIPATDDSPEDADRLAGEIRRTLASLPHNGTVPSITLWGGRKTLGESLAKKLNLTFAQPKMSRLTTPLAEENRKFAPALALGLAWFESTHLPVNFLKSRLAPQKKADNRRRIMWASAAAIFIAGITLIGIVDMQQKTSQLEFLQKKIADNTATAKRAQAAADRLKTARSWTAQNPTCLSALRDLTNLFPEDATLYATSFNYKPEKVIIPNNKRGAEQSEVTTLTVQLAGKAASEQQVLALLDKLKDSKLFYDPKLLELRNATRGSRQVAFSLTFTYRGKE